MTTSNTLNINNGIGQVWSLILGFFHSIMTGFAGLFNDIFSGLGTGLGTAFKGWGNELSSYGVWALAMLVISVMTAVIILYLFFMVLEPEKQITQMEADA